MLELTEVTECSPIDGFKVNCVKLKSPVENTSGALIPRLVLTSFFQKSVFPIHLRSCFQSRREATSCRLVSTMGRGLGLKRVHG